MKYVGLRVYCLENRINVWIQSLNLMYEMYKMYLNLCSHKRQLSELSYELRQIYMDGLK